MLVSPALNAACPSTTTNANRVQLVFSPVCYPHSRTIRSPYVGTRGYPV
jgi:hypothetical protein